MSDSVFADTNIIIYSFSNDARKRKTALEILAARPVISTQVISETVNTLRRKFSFTAEQALEIAQKLEAEAIITTVTTATIMSSLKLSAKNNYSYYDNLILATALEIGCVAIYSEDFQHGQLIEGTLKITNPFR